MQSYILVLGKDEEDRSRPSAVATIYISPDEAENILKELEHVGDHSALSVQHLWSLLNSIASGEYQIAYHNRNEAARSEPKLMRELLEGSTEHG